MAFSVILARRRRYSSSWNPGWSASSWPPNCRQFEENASKSDIFFGNQGASVALLSAGMTSASEARIPRLCKPLRMFLTDAGRFCTGCDVSISMWNSLGSVLLFERIELRFTWLCSRNSRAFRSAPGWSWTVKTTAELSSLTCRRECRDAGVGRKTRVAARSMVRNGLRGSAFKGAFESSGRAGAFQPSPDRTKEMQILRATRGPESGQIRLGWRLQARATSDVARDEVQNQLRFSNSDQNVPATNNLERQLVPAKSCRRSHTSEWLICVDHIFEYNPCLRNSSECVPDSATLRSPSTMI
mmetsp:Transcript_6866/g.16750  ORF Transcript_6866/g.16750 Transcript_6866/m.16750 type:complete len:300 (+) Transcript_6866:944-1843(+)